MRFIFVFGCLFLIFRIDSYSQEKINGLFGVGYRTTVEQTKSIMAKHHDATITLELKDVLSYDIKEVFGFPASLTFIFKDNVLKAAGLTYKIDAVEVAYYRIQEHLTSEYGDPFC